MRSEDGLARGNWEHTLFSREPTGPDDGCKQWKENLVTSTDEPPPADNSPEKDSSDQTAEEHREEAKEPSLGPACLVVAILSLAVFCSVCAFGSWIAFSDQYPLAEKGITQQLIPWVESSQLASADKKSIVAQLRALIPKLQEREIDKRQLSRLHNCLQDNPVLLWGGVQSIVAQAPAAGLTETEQIALQRVSQRLLRMATDRKLSRNDIEFTLQNCSRVRDDQAGIEVVSPLSAEQIRGFMQRGEQLVTEHNVPNIAYDKTPAEAFSMLIDAALAVE